MTFIHVPRFYYYYIVIKAMWISNFVYQEFLKLFSINTFSFSHVRPFENFFPNKLYGSVIFQNCIRLWIFKNVRTFPELCWKLLDLRSCHILLEEPGQNLHHLHILENNKMFKIFKVFFLRIILTLQRDCCYFKWSFLPCFWRRNVPAILQRKPTILKNQFKNYYNLRVS